MSKLSAGVHLCRVVVRREGVTLALHALIKVSEIGTCRQTLQVVRVNVNVTRT